MSGQLIISTTHHVHVLAKLLYACNTHMCPHAHIHTHTHTHTHRTFCLCESVLAIPLELPDPFP